MQIGWEREQRRGKRRRRRKKERKGRGESPQWTTILGSILELKCLLLSPAHIVYFWQSRSVHAVPWQIERAVDVQTNRFFEHMFFELPRNCSLSVVVFRSPPIYYAESVTFWCVQIWVTVSIKKQNNLFPSIKVYQKKKKKGLRKASCFHTSGCKEEIRKKIKSLFCWSLSFGKFWSGRDS